MSQITFHRIDVDIASDGINLNGWLYLPKTEGLSPTIVMSAGFACVKDLFVDRFAERFANAGFAVLLCDHRNFGKSGGDIRGEINPWQQIEDMRNAITWASLRPEVDLTRMGLWGSSYSGGHAIVLGGTDQRLRCIVAQVPTISGHQSFLRRIARRLSSACIKPWPKTADIDMREGTRLAVA